MSAFDIVDTFEDGGGDKLDLVEARCETWNGCFFVIVSGDAEPLADWLQPLLQRTANYDFSSIR